jgi:orotidine-5'-phosphate decarboxylase
MNRNQLVEIIKHKKSFLCIGLDSDIAKIPQHLKDSEDPVFEFNKQIIDATHDIAVAYKPNLAFYESNGVKGMQSLEKTINYLNKFKKEIFTIADAKRGDIGNTSKLYAKGFFGNVDSACNFDAVTVAPYMGEDSVSPFLEYEGKWVILLALTSNKGAFDFQYFKTEDGVHLFEKVLKVSQQWANAEQMMYVVGATKADMLAQIRKIVPEHFLLVPGVGAQGGNLHDVATFGMNTTCGLLVNASRNIIFAGSGEDFAVKAREEAQKIQLEMNALLKQKGVIA